MSGLSIFDVLLHSSTDGASSPTTSDAGRMAQLAEQLVDSSLNDYEELERLDRFLAPRDEAQWDLHVAALLRGMYEQWAREAEGVLERVVQVSRLGGKVEKASELRNSHGRVRAMLSIALQEIAEARQQLKDGRSRTLGEVRRELRLGSQR